MDQGDRSTEDLREPLLSSPEVIIGDESPSSEVAADQEIRRNIKLPRCWGTRSLEVNHNVFLNLVVAVLYGISSSLWNGTAYVAYLKKLGHDKNGPLGNIEAVSGLASLLFALPTGYLADRLGRSKVIAAGGLLGILTTLSQISVMEWLGTSPGNEQTKTGLFLLGMIMWFWGVGDGIVNGPCAALYADSTPKGKRSRYYNILFACYSGASAVGPLVSILLFQILGDDWSLYDLRIVIYVGLSIEFLVSIIMTLFDDKKALDESEVNEVAPGEVRRSVPNDIGESVDTETSDASSEDQLMQMQKRQKWIPYIIFIQDLILAMGSGMTIKFFPLFFKDDVGMSPSQVQVIYCMVPFTMVICSTLSSKIAATGVGRVQTQLVSNMLGVSLLYSMVFFKSYLDAHPVLLVPIYVLRTSFMNACYPLQESILMDFVTKEVRARWKSLDAVASFGWCGSAAFGGWLADKYDYTYTFFLTAIVQTFGIFVWSLLLPLVPRHENESSNSSDGASEESQTHDNVNQTAALEDSLMSDRESS